MRTALPALLAILVLTLSTAARAEEKNHPVVIPLDPFGIPKGLFPNTRPFACFHVHTAGTRIFWLDTTHIFVAFTTNSPCTVKSGQEPASIRGIVFDRSGTKIATRDWPAQDDLTVFAGPGRSIVVWKGNRLEFFDSQLRPIDSGELSEKPKGIWVTPRRRTIPLLSADGRNFEFYGTNPLKLLTTIALDQSSEINKVTEWVPGDERVAGSLCRDKSEYTCTKILVVTPDANFITPDGAPWSYEETDKPVSLQPIGFLDPTHLLISRQDKNFFHSPQLFIVRPTGAKTPVPGVGYSYTVHDLIGVADNRFALEFYAQGLCDECIAGRRFVVGDMDAHKFLFEKNGSAYFSRAELCPDGKSIAILDNNAISIYTLPGA
ncbi:MAG: hypothetical protein JO300_13465 [Silvibacterium sp.]|nr:hypothetical protein [Silvibacterium sp.]MBV8438851.1 hypothetical protein [Silvibacterium sp.]